MNRQRICGLILLQVLSFGMIVSDLPRFRGDEVNRLAHIIIQIHRGCGSPVLNDADGDCRNLQYKQRWLSALVGE